MLSMFSRIIYLILMCILFTSVKANASSEPDYGLLFKCSPEQLNLVSNEVDRVINDFSLSNFVIKKRLDNSLSVYISKQFIAQSTLYVKNNPIFDINDEKITKIINGKIITKKIVSQKEILTSLLSPGRLTVLSGDASCSPNTLKKLLTIRQNIVFWGSDPNWGWPNGEKAEWNESLWDKGTPKNIVKAFDDLFSNPQNYKIGCYTATKAVYIQAYLDTYRNNYPNELGLVINALNSDAEPFVNVEPQRMWYFENDYVFTDSDRFGKLLTINEHVAANNFIAGDWVYMRNTDPNSNEKVGYEGSNTVYLGSGMFSDYYDDHMGGYPYERKLDEVFQWRNGVFSRSADLNKIELLNSNQRFSLTLSPEDGGIVEKYRIEPLLF